MRVRASTVVLYITLDGCVMMLDYGAFELGVDFRNLIMRLLRYFEVNTFTIPGICEWVSMGVT